MGAGAGPHLRLHMEAVKATLVVCLTSPATYQLKFRQASARMLCCAQAPDRHHLDHLLQILLK